jgi:hypothetical protein
MVGAVASKSPKDELVMHLMRSLFFILAHYNMQITVQYGLASTPGRPRESGDGLVHTDCACP